MNIKKLFDINHIAYEKRIFGILIALVTFPVLLLGILASLLFVNSEKRQLDLMTHSYYNSINSDYESIFTQIKQYYSNFVQTDDFRWLRSQEDIPYSQYSNISEAQRMLEGNLFLKSIIHRYTYVNVEHGWVLSQYGMAEMKDVVNLREVEQFIHEQGNVNSDSFWIYRPMGKMTALERANNHFVELEGVNLVIKQGKTGAGLPKNMILIQLNSQALRNMLGDILPAGYEGALLDRNSQTILETMPDFYQRPSAFGPAGNMDMSIQNKNIQDKHIPDKYTWKTPAGERYYVEQGELSANGFFYLVGYNRKTSTENAGKFLLISVGIAGLMALLLLLVRKVSTNLSKPVKDLNEQLKLEKEQHQTSFLVTMLKGIESNEYLENEISCLKLPVQSCYRVMVIDTVSDEPHESANINEINRRLLEYIPEEINAGLLLPSIVYHKRIVFLISGQDEAQINKKTTTIYYTLKEIFDREINEPVFFGASRHYHQLEGTKRAYNEAREALEKSHKASASGENLNFMIYEQGTQPGTGRNAYDLIVEKELLHAIKEGNTQQAKLYLTIYLEKMQLKNLRGAERQFYLTKLILGMIQMLPDAGADLEMFFANGTDNIIEQAFSLYRQEELKAFLFDHLVEPIAAQMQAMKNTSSASEIVRKAIRLIKENRGNISLSECAGQLNYHPTYITKLLKKELDQTFTQLCNQEKINQAKTLLLTTDYSVAQIAEILNYNNTQNFIRFFSKYEEITPARYKKEHKSDSLK